jgi:MinD-like ATPase involved in chromosome partitioning or flagellar assembly
VQPGQVVVAGAHGGAGTSTLAALLGPAWDLGTVSRRRPWRPPPSVVPVILVARCTVASAARAVAAVSVLAAGGTRVTVLAVTGDGLPEPGEAAYLFSVLEGRVDGVVRVPFIPAFRAAADPRQVHLTRRARSALAEIRSLAAAPASWPRISP